VTFIDRVRIPGGHDIHDAFIDDGRRLEGTDFTRLEGAYHPEPRDVAGIDFGEPRIALAGVGLVVHQPSIVAVLQELAIDRPVGGRAPCDLGGAGKDGRFWPRGLVRGGRLTRRRCDENGVQRICRHRLFARLIAVLRQEKAGDIEVFPLGETAGSLFRHPLLDQREQIAELVLSVGPAMQELHTRQAERDGALQRIAVAGRAILLIDRRTGCRLIGREVGRISAGDDNLRGAG
jgi:hypothetical protein